MWMTDAPLPGLVPALRFEAVGGNLVDVSAGLFLLCYAEVGGDAVGQTVLPRRRGSPSQGVPAAFSPAVEPARGLPCPRYSGGMDATARFCASAIALRSASRRLASAAALAAARSRSCARRLGPIVEGYLENDHAASVGITQASSTVAATKKPRGRNGGALILVLS